MKRYLLDSNVLIQAHRMYYPFDVVPGFWTKLIDLSNRGLICSIDKVKKEIFDTSTPDELALWCINDMKAAFFVNTSYCVDKYAEIALWVQSNRHFMQSAKDDFLATDLADPWLIAYAMKHGCIIVTHEVSQPNRRNKIKIPEPCIYFGIPYISLYKCLESWEKPFNRLVTTNQAYLNSRTADQFFASAEYRQLTGHGCKHASSLKKQESE